MSKVKDVEVSAFSECFLSVVWFKGDIAHFRFGRDNLDEFDGKANVKACRGIAETYKNRTREVRIFLNILIKFVTFFNNKTISYIYGI